MPCSPRLLLPISFSSFSSVSTLYALSMIVQLWIQHEATVSEGIMESSVQVLGSLIILSVYDVTKYLDDHPGGDDVLISATGRDSTEEFEDAGHSKTARELMKDYCVGEIDKSHVNVISELEIFTKEKPSNYELFNSPTLLNWLLPAALVGLSVLAAAVFYTRKK
ncbi:cytochrome b5-like [Phalaenopsis equestris]|uniref:cytochrome b5-like n=1 Tax=Phalaenopsis equestris TaxID=78828 RepID=UPI0009E1C220|nr:cytochrome b5-like [Phalaenopsis equestris]